VERVGVTVTSARSGSDWDAAAALLSRVEAQQQDRAGGGEAQQGGRQGKQAHGAGTRDAAGSCARQARGSGGAPEPDGGRARGEEKRGSPKPGSDGKKGSGEDGEGGRASEYYAQMGDAIRALRADLPLIFDPKHEPAWEIYREDVGLIVNIETPPKLRTRLQGLDNYKVAWRWFRQCIRVFFRDPQLEVKRIWQPVDGIVMVRWAIHGGLRGVKMDEGAAIFEGSSEFKLDKDGLIYEHRLDNKAMSDRGLGIRQPTWQLELARIASPQRTGIPTFCRPQSPLAVAGGVVSHVLCSAIRRSVLRGNKHIAPGGSGS